MRFDLTQFRAPHARKSLAGRPTDEDIDGCRDIAKIQILGESFRCQFSDITGDAVKWISAVKIASMGSCRIGIKFDGGRDFEVCRMEPKGQTTTARKQIENSRATSPSNPGHFLADMAGVPHRPHPSLSAQTTAICFLYNCPPLPEPPRPQKPFSPWR